MPPAPTSAFVELMILTRTLSEYLNISFFEIFDRDISDVLMLIDYYIEYGSMQSANVNTVTNTKTKETRIRVNDKTATGGWF